MNNQIFCRNCGKALPPESQFCPYCMTKLVDEKNFSVPETKKKKVNKKLLIIVALVLFAVTIIAVVAGLFFNGTFGAESNGDKTDSVQEAGDKPADEKNGIATVFKSKSVENDDNIGLMNIKINENADHLTDTQKLLVQYFDTDYFRAPYNSLQRYPQVYKEAQIEFLCYVTKIIESNDEEYTALVEYEAFKQYDGFYQGTGDFAVIRGKQSETRFMEGDSLYIYGVYEGVSTYEVDGKSYTVPSININRFTYMYYFDDVEPMYSMEEIRSIARFCFGDDVKIRYTTNDDIDDASIDYPYEEYQGLYYTAELDNQSNANFTKYMFFAGLGGNIEDCKSKNFVTRKITFSADFEHFYLQIFDTQLNVYTLECYNRDLEKLWSREFDETTKAVLDYTVDHIYLVANGSMYIIDAQSGEDAVEPKYVGAKIGIRKLEDGILLLSYDRSDSVMKTDLVGNVQWTANLSYDVDFPIVQINGGNYVIQYEAQSNDGFAGTYSAVITPDGKVEFDGKAF